MASKDNQEREPQTDSASQSLHRGKTALEWSEGLQDADADVRIKSVKALRTMGLSAESALPGIVPLLSDPSEKVRLTVIQAVAVLVRKFRSVTNQTSGKHIQDSDPEKVHTAQSFNELISEALPSVVNCVRQDETAIRLAGLRALERIDQRFPEDVVVLSLCVEDSESDVRAAAIRCTRKLSPQLSPRDRPQWQNLILKASMDSSSAVRAEALSALCDVGVSDRKVRSVCLNALDDPNGLVRKRAGEQLAWNLANMPLLQFSAQCILAVALPLSPSTGRKEPVTVLPRDFSDLLNEIAEKRQEAGLDNISEEHMPDLTASKKSILRILACTAPTAPRA